MDRDQKNEPTEKEKNEKIAQEDKKRLEEKIDEELEDTFPASDPPSYSQPGNDDIKKRTWTSKSPRLLMGSRKKITTFVFL